MIVNNANLVTLWSSEPFVEGALVAIEGKTIVDFGPVGKLVDRYDHPDVLDVSGRLVLPGEINAHTCLYPGGASPTIDGALDEDTLYWSSLVMLLDAVRAGVTTVFVSISSPSYVEGSLEAVRRAFTEVRLRGALSQVVSPRSATAVVLRETIRHLATCKGPDSEWMRGFFGLEVSASLDEEVLSKSVAASEKAEAPFHVISREREPFPGGPDPWERLAQSGLAGRGGLLVQEGELPPAGERLLGDSGMWLVHSAQSDALADVDSPDLSRLSAAGMRLALGSGGWGQSMGEEFRVATHRQVAKGQRAKDAARLVSSALMEGNPDLATRTFGPALGRIKPGARADLVVLDYWPPVVPKERNWPSLFFKGASRAMVRSVIVSGRLLYHNGRFVDLDEERARARAREAMAKLWRRL